MSGAKLGRQQRCQAGEGQPHCPQPPWPWAVPVGKGWVPLTEDAVLMDFTAASNTFLGSLRLVVPLSTMLLS